MRTPTTRRRSTIGAIILAATLMLAATASVSAGRPDAVDPSLMTPALNPSFDWECWRAGDRIVCDGERTTEYTAVEAIPCPDGGWIYATGSAFHMHPVTVPAATSHAHCEPKVGSPEHEHYRYIELSVYEALEEHEKWWATDTDLTCERLRPLGSIGHAQPPLTSRRSA